MSEPHEHVWTWGYILAWNERQRRHDQLSTTWLFCSICPASIDLTPGLLALGAWTQPQAVIRRPSFLARLRRRLATCSAALGR